MPEDVPEKPHADEAYLATGHAERQLGWFRQLGRLAGSAAGSAAINIFCMCTCIDKYNIL